MRIGLIPDGLLERFKLRSRQFPQPIFDVMGTMLFSRAVMAGVHFSVFDRLADGAKTAAAVATEAGANGHGMRLLLDALVACGYLEREGELYRNTPLGNRWLRSDGAQTLVNFVRYNYDQWEWVSHLEAFIERGEARDIHEKLEARAWRSYMLGLKDLAALSADELVSKLRLDPPPRSLLDIGGGHCHYVIAMCRRYPGLRATVVDLDPAARIGREQVDQAGLSQRVEFRIGHLKDTDFGNGHDVAFIFNLLHHLDEETCHASLRRVQAALNPGGKLVVWESFREEREKQQRDQLGSLLALFFGVASRREAYEFEQVAGWARAAGFTAVQEKKLRTAPFAALLVATK